MGELETFAIEQAYAWDADRHFAAIVRYDELSKAMEGQASYAGLPEGEAQPGQVFEVKIKLMGWLPIGLWRIEVLERDDDRRILRSIESGGAVKLWRHTLTVTPRDEGGCVHRDALEIDAGWLTGLYAGMARRMYERRHADRLRLRVGP